MMAEGNWKLTAWRLGRAWRVYPRQFNALRSYPHGRPILITGSHRSGTTWVARMLAQPGLWYVHEPFNPNKKIWAEPFPYRRPGAGHGDVDNLVRGLLAGRLRQTSILPEASHPLMPLRLFPQPVHRVMIKDPLACLLTGYLTRRFDFQTLVLFRHPCGFVTSVMDLGWPTAGFLRMFLERDDLIEDHLYPVKDVIRQYSKEDGIGAAAALHGVLNLVLWNTCISMELRYATYEDLCADPITEFRNLYRWLGLQYSGDVIAEHQRLCFARSLSVGDYHPHGTTRNSLTCANSWRHKISIREARYIRKIWNEFDIPLYDQDDEWRPIRP